MPFAFYTDAALTNALTGNLEVNISPTTFHLYLGHTSTGKKIETATGPGVNNITITVVDSATGSGHPTTDIKLATTTGALASGTQSLTIGTSLTGGSANAYDFYIMATDSLGGVSSSTELSIQTPSLVESNL
jgi:hypothetical protein